MHDATAENAVVVSTPVANNVSEITKYEIKYNMKKFHAVAEISSEINFSLIFTGNSADGWRIFNNSLFINLNSSITLITFIPPPVEPAHAPMKLAVSNVDKINDGHKLYEVLVKPDVVINETVWKKTCRKLVKLLSNVA